MLISEHREGLGGIRGRRELYVQRPRVGPLPHPHPCLCPCLHPPPLSDPRNSQLWRR